jgi:hypothetical protein
MHTALIRDCRGANRERLHFACDCPSWTVASDEFYAGHCFTSFGENRPTPTWSLRTCHSTTQLGLICFVQYIMHRRRWGTPREEPIPHPWQTEPPPPVNVTIDISNHHPRSLSAPVGWEVIQRNGRIWMVEQNNRVTKIDAGQYHMLLAMYETPAANSVAPAQLLASIRSSCRAQKAADLEYHVPCSRHLLKLASLRGRTGCELLVGASAVTHNPHFPYFVSPYPSDECLGAIKECPPVPALLVIDSFAPHVRGSVLKQAVAHRPGVWVLRQHVGDPEKSVPEQLRWIARLQAELPKKSRVLHQAGCWEAVTWDVELLRFSTQLWTLNTTADALRQTHHGVMRHLLDCEGSHRYAFH